MSDRILLVRMMGLGSLLTDGQLVLTSRGTLPYLDPAATLPGVITDLGDQFSSEIGFFESMGSDPTTAFSVLSTAETRAALLGRRKVAVLDANGAPVETTSYVPPLFNRIEIGVTDTSGMFPGQRIRIGTIAMRVEDVLGPYAIECSRIWGSPRTPIPMILSGLEAVGMVIYDATLSTGNVEGLPIVVSTAEVTATSRAEEEVIYRGIVTKTAVDTSHRAANQISVQCGSLMGYLRNSAFRPIAGKGAELTVLRSYLEGAPLETAQNYYYPTQLQLTVNASIYGTPTDGLDPTFTRTSMRAFQVRDGGRGGAFPPSVDEIRPWIVRISGQNWLLNYQMPITTTVSEIGDTASTAFLWVFDGGFFTAKGESPITDAMASFDSERRRWATGVVSAIVESAFVCAGNVPPVTMLQDLLMGTVDGLEGDRGWRNASEAAWLPFSDNETIADVVDWGSLEALLQGRDDVFPDANPRSNLRPLPYDANGAKTIGDVLSLILKRLGGFVVYDRGKLRFGSWAVNNPIPTVVDDSALAEPMISLDFDRSACLQAVELEVGTYRWRYDQSSDSNRVVKRPVTNLDLGAAGLGKVTGMGGFTSTPDHPFTIERFLMGSTAFAMANHAIVRYSQPAARVTVTYRDAVRDLTVGETVAFSTAYLPSATGEMGVALATGIVLKAARSWKTPTTEYSLLLFGYVGASSTKVPLIAVSAQCTGVVDGSKVYVTPVWFTRGPLATGGAPTSDVEAFAQATSLAGTTGLAVILLDEHGTEVGGGADYAEPDVAGSALRFPGVPFLGTTILPGYVITLANATSAGLQGWDAYQADTDGTVLGADDNAFPWVN